MGKNQILATDDDLAAAIAALLAIEPRFQAVIDMHGHPPLRRDEASLKALLRIITDQLISLKAGAAIWSRLENHLAPFDPAFVAAASEDHLMSLGLSRAKARSFIAVADTVASGKLDFTRTRAAGCRIGSQIPDRAARHWPVDGGYLPSVGAWACRRMARRRPGPAGCGP
ncbi:hypothetical protein [Aestuariivirga sp.]|uniref:hypothetical protein n=1 Tax=Aestuariivirga sp. TaxID=2650926 RepID=UPI0039E2A1C3